LAQVYKHSSHGRGKVLRVTTATLLGVTAEDRTPNITRAFISEGNWCAWNPSGASFICYLSACRSDTNPWQIQNIRKIFGQSCNRVRTASGHRLSQLSTCRFHLHNLLPEKRRVDASHHPRFDALSKQTKSTPQVIRSVRSISS